MRWGGINSGESGLASSHFLMCTPQLDHSEMFTELYREEKKEAGDRGGQKDKRGKWKGGRQIQPVISCRQILYCLSHQGSSKLTEVPRFSEFHSQHCHYQSLNKLQSTLPVFWHGIHRYGKPTALCRFIERTEASMGFGIHPGSWSQFQVNTKADWTWHRACSLICETGKSNCQLKGCVEG